MEDNGNSIDAFFYVRQLFLMGLDLVDWAIFVDGTHSDWILTLTLESYLLLL